MMKIYVCGDSFCCCDIDWPEYSWVERLQHKLGERGQVISLARRCASNFFARLQIDKAIQAGADFIVLSATSSFRQEVRFQSANHKHVDLYDRFIDLQHEEVGLDLATYSLLSLDDSTRFGQEQLHLLQEYHKNFFDADLEIVRNWHVIQGSLDAMTRAQVPFLFSPGGFEHHSYAGSRDINFYWRNYLDQIPTINLWDHAQQRGGFSRPYFHVQDQAVLEEFADQCLARIDNINSCC